MTFLQDQMTPSATFQSIMPPQNVWLLVVAYGILANLLPGLVRDAMRMVTPLFRIPATSCNGML